MRKWCSYLAADNYRGAGRVFAWSFYSQGSSERVASADEFVDAALRFFGDPEPEAGSAWSRGERLAGLVRAANGLLVLDGLEPLQDRYQGIKDPALGRLIEVLAADDAGDGRGGLCVITTREPVQELADFSETSTSVDLEQLSPEAGRALLRIKGVRGSDTALEQASRDFGNHALAIRLLASYLRAIPGRHVEAAAEIPDLPAIPVEQGRYPRRVMAAFVERYEADPELELLYLVSLFDRPTNSGCINELCHPPAIDGLTNLLIKLTEVERLHLTDRLRDIGLLAPRSQRDPTEIDAHHLVREHISFVLEKTNRKAMTSGHLRIFRYFEARFPSQAENLHEMGPIFRAMHHGCKAGQHSKMLVDIYRGRIQRNNEFFATQQLGAYGSILAALSDLFFRPYIYVLSSISNEMRTYVLNEAAIALRARGMLREAVAPMRAALGNATAGQRIRKRNTAIIAAQVSSNLIDLHLTLGEIETAIAQGERGQIYANASGSWNAKANHLARLASAQHQHGLFEQSLEFFQESEKKLASSGSFCPILYANSGNFNELLLDLERSQEVIRRVATTRHWEKLELRPRNLLGISCDHITIGRAYLALGEINEAKKELDLGVETLRQAGELPMLAYGLISRASLFRIGPDAVAAQRDLAEAMRLATRCEMKLQECDACLEMVGLALREEVRHRVWPLLARAARIINETGYFRRSAALRALQLELTVD